MVVMEPVSGQLLAPAAPQLHTSTTWVDVHTGQHVRMELRESTLAPETDTDRVRQAASTAQKAWECTPPPWGQPDQYGYASAAGGLTDEEAARVFGQRYGGTWRPVQW